MSPSSSPQSLSLDQQILDAIGERILELPAGFSAESDLYDAGLDSMATMQLMLLLEERFGVNLPESHISCANFRTVHQLARLVEKCQAARA